MKGEKSQGKVAKYLPSGVLMKKGVVIGGGIAGLVSASVLASKGYEITLLERNVTLGGKLQKLQVGEYTYDFGPTMITMPWVFERVFREAGKTVDPMLRFLPLTVTSRNFFGSGSMMDLSSDAKHMLDQLDKFSPENREGFLAYLHEIERIYKVVAENFFENPVVEWSDYFSPTLLKSLLSVHPFQSMDHFHRTFFDDSRLVAMMNRYATYIGSSPYQTPATLSWIAYLELVQGAFYIEGGNYRLIESFERLARSVGVKIYKSTPAEEILSANGVVTGVRTEDHVWEADFVISNVDVRTTKEQLLSQTNRSSKHSNPSMSGFITLLGINKKFPHLHHHNLFFPENYGREFVDIFDLREWSLSPAIYVCNSSFSEYDRAPKEGSNLYIQINVPANEGNQREESWFDRYYQYRENIVYWLENDWGLKGLEESIEEERFYGPKEIEEMSGAWQGSIHGPVFHGKGAFLRPPMKDPRIEGLYYTGGSTHPGGGTPMAALSGLTIAQIIERKRKQDVTSYLRKSGS